MYSIIELQTKRGGPLYFTGFNEFGNGRAKVRYTPNKAEAHKFGKLNGEDMLATLKKYGIRGTLIPAQEA